MPPLNAIRHESVHYMVLPAPQFWNSPSPLNFQISFSGEAVIDFKGNDNGSWRNERLELITTDMGWNNIMERVKNALPPLPPNYTYAFVPLQWTVYASVNSQLDAGSSENAGFGAYNFGITKNGGDLSGMYVDIQVRDKDARIYRIAYAMNVYGYFRKVVPIG